MFTANLTAVAGVTTSATGQATFELSPNGQTLNYTLTVTNISNVFMAHIHLSSNMDIVVWLYPNPNTVVNGGLTSCVAVLSNGPIASCPGYKAGSFSGVLAQGSITAADLSGNNTCAGCSGLSTPTMATLIADIESGATYVNVHTMQNPGGEIQGTIAESMVLSTCTSTSVSYVGALPAVALASTSTSTSTESCSSTVSSSTSSTSTSTSTTSTSTSTASTSTTSSSSAISVVGG